MSNKKEDGVCWKIKIPGFVYEAMKKERAEEDRSIHWLVVRCLKERYKEEANND